MVLRILCQLLRQVETPWGAVKLRVGITDLREKEGFGKTSGSASSQAAHGEDCAAVQVQLPLGLGSKVRTG